MGHYLWLGHETLVCTVCISIFVYLHYNKKSYLLCLLNHRLSKASGLFVEYFNRRHRMCGVIWKRIDMLKGVMIK